MSSNPFADSSAHRSRGLDDNPFADTSDPNPFEDDDVDLEGYKKPSGYAASGAAPSAYTLGGSISGAGGAGMTEREQELARKDEEIRQREAELARREQALDRSEAKPNWPFFFPLIRHHIGDLPTANQSTMKALYVQWLALLGTLVLNLVSCILLLIAGSSDGGKDTAASGSYLFVITVTSFFLWYRPIYLGYAKENGLALFFYLYFFFAGWHLLFSIYMLIGIPSTGSAGLINTVSMMSQGHILAGVFGMVTSIGWAFQTFAGAYLYQRTWDFKNNHEGLDFQNATNQFKRESFKTVVLHQSRL